MTRVAERINVVERIKRLELRIQNIEREKQIDHSAIVPDKKIYLDGETKLTYLIYNSASNRLEVYVNDGASASTLAGYFDLNNTGTRFANV